MDRNQPYGVRARCMAPSVRVDRLGGAVAVSATRSRTQGRETHAVRCPAAWWLHENHDAVHILPGARCRVECRW